MPRTWSARVSARSRVGRQIIVRLAIIGASGLLALVAGTAPTVLAASCNGASHDLSLSAGAASPGSGTTATSFQFTVRYQDTGGCAPTSIRLVIAGGTYTLAGSGTNYASGVTFSTTRRLPIGTWAYRFTATSGSGAGAKSVTLTSVSPSTVTVSAPPPPPTPKPTPKPTAPPTPKPTPKPTAQATPKPAPPPTPRATARPTPKPSTSAATTPGTSSPTPDDRQTPEPSPGSTSALAFGSGGTSGPPSSPSVPGQRSGDSPFGNVLVPIAGWATTTMLGIVLYALLVRRRPDWQELMPAYDMGEASAQPRLTGTAYPIRSPIIPLLSAPDGVPRLPWLRPSLRGEQVEMQGGPVARPPIKFAKSAKRGVDRRTVTYRLVKLADRPEDLYSPEIARLDRGDEVEVIGFQGDYVRVRTADGLVGWIPGITTLG
jgi:hypothetical protein